MKKALLFLLILSFPLMFMAQTKEETAMSQQDLGIFSLSLAVKDIQKSYDFYQKLGFKHLEGAGSVDQKWMILVHGTTKIGLFQDMFPANILTFNPEDARKIHAQAEAAGIKVDMANGMDKDAGPCSLMITDPDGNSILIDQH